ncbi:MAG: hypothetical protein ACYC69_06185 [Thermodesulfovibrionales bacterium]
METGYPDILDITYVITGKDVTGKISLKSDRERGISGEEKGPLLRRMR